MGARRGGRGSGFEQKNQRSRHTLSHRGSQLTSHGFTPSSLENKGATAIGGRGPIYTLASNRLLAVQRNLKLYKQAGTGWDREGPTFSAIDAANMSRAAKSLSKPRWHTLLQWTNVDVFWFVFLGMGDAFILQTISSNKTSQILSRQSYRLKSTVKLSGSDEDDMLQYSQVAGSGWVPGHGFGRKIEVRVRTVEEGLATLTVGEVGLKNQTRTRAGLRVQRTAADRQAILHIKTEETETERGKCLEILMWRVCVISFFDFESFLSSQLATRPSDYHFQTFGFPSQAVMEHFCMSVKKNCTHFQQTAFWALCLESTAQTTGFSFLQKAVVHTLCWGGVTTSLEEISPLVISQRVVCFKIHFLERRLS